MNTDKPNMIVQIRTNLLKKLSFIYDPKVHAVLRAMHYLDQQLTGHPNIHVQL